MRYVMTESADRRASVESTSADQAIPIPIQFCQYATRSHHELKEACKTFEKVLVQNLQSGLNKDLAEAIRSIPRWKLIQASLPHVMHASASLLFNRMKDGNIQSLGATETKLMYTLHWTILDAAEECADFDYEKGVFHSSPFFYLFPISTITLFVYLFAPLCQQLKESDFQNFRLELGLKIWQPMWEFRYPDAPCFTTPCKPKPKYLSSKNLKHKTQFGDVFLGRSLPNANIHKKITVRIVIFVIYLYATLLATYYGAGITSSFTSPAYSNPITTLQDMVDNKIRWPQSSSILREVFLTTNTSVLNKLAELNIVETNISVLRQLAYTRKYGFLVKTIRNRYVTGTGIVDDHMKKNMKVLKECFGTFDSVFILKRYSPYTSLLNKYIRKFNEHGFLDYWVNLMVQKSNKHYMNQFFSLSVDGISDEVKLGLEEILGVMYLLLFGYAIAVIVAIGEICHKRLSTRQFSKPITVKGEYLH